MCQNTLIFYTVFLFVSPVRPVKIDMVDCGVDNDPTVQLGEVNIDKYPWLGVLTYTDPFEPGDFSAVTPVALIQPEFCIGAAAEIAEIPPDNFIKQSHVIFGEDWRGQKRRLLALHIHPHYGQTYNTLALIHLKDPIRLTKIIRHLCPPPELLTDPEFYVVRFKNDFTNLQKEVLAMYYVPPRMCRDFYVAAKLYAVKMRPPHVVCACTMENDDICVWEAGALLVTRDVWGRWQLLGFGVRGPGCASPSRYLDMLSYYPWIHSTLHKFRRFQISKLHPHKYVLRSSDDADSTVQTWGECHERDYLNIVYKDIMIFKTDSNHFQFLTYNLSLVEKIDVTCMYVELVNASATADVNIRHFCHRAPTPLKLPDTKYEMPSHAGACYVYNSSIFEISFVLMFAQNCLMKIFIYGYYKNMTLLDVWDWHWEEGTYYDDFDIHRVEYHGPSYMTGFGYEPLDPDLWVPDYDLYATTEFNPNMSTSTTTPPPPKEVGGGKPPPAGPFLHPKSPTMKPGAKEWVNPKRIKNTTL